MNDDDMVEIGNFPTRCREVFWPIKSGSKEAWLIRLSYAITSHPWVATTDLEVPLSDAVKRLWRERQWAGRMVRRGVHR